MTSNIVSIITNIDNTNNCSLNLNTIKINFTAKIDSNKYKIEEKYKTISDDTQEIINNNIEIDYNTNKCDGYIKVKEQLVEQNNFIDEQIQILNNIVGTTVTGETGELGEIKQSITNYSNAKAKLLNNITIINNTCNLILSDIFDKYVDNENPISIKKKFTDLETDINAVSTESTDSSLSLKNTIDGDKNRLKNKRNAIVTHNDYSAGSSPFSDLSSYKKTNTLTDEDDLMYEEVNNLCLGSNVNDSGACIQSKWGCKLSCQFLERKDGDGNQECSRLGSTANEIDYDIYENIYGETVKIHSHIHTHPGPHPHPMPDDS